MVSVESPMGNRALATCSPVNIRYWHVPSELHDTPWTFPPDKQGETGKHARGQEAAKEACAMALRGGKRQEAGKGRKHEGRGTSFILES